RQIPSQSEDFGLLIRGNDARFLALKFCGLFFEFLPLKQSIIPALFQCARDQTLGRIDFLIAPLGERGFIRGKLDPHLPLTQDEWSKARVWWKERFFCQFDKTNQVAALATAVAVEQLLA